MRRITLSALALSLLLFCGHVAIAADILINEQHMTLIEIQATNMIAKAQSMPSIGPGTIGYLNAIKGNPEALSHFEYYAETGGFGRPFTEQLKDVGKVTTLLGAITTAAPTLEGIAKAFSFSGVGAYDGISAVGRLGKDIYLGPLVSMDLDSHRSALFNSSLIQGLKSSEDLLQAAQTNPTLRSILTKLKLLNDSGTLTPEGAKFLKDHLILRPDEFAEVAKDPKAVEQKKAELKNKADDAQKKANDLATASDSDLKSQLPEYGQSLQVYGTAAYYLGVITHDQRLQDAGQITTAAGNYVAAIDRLQSATQAAEVAQSAASAFSAGVGLILTIQSIHESQDAQDEQARVFQEIFDRLRTLTEALIKLEQRVLALEIQTRENFNFLSLQINYDSTRIDELSASNLKQQFINARNTLAQSNSAMIEMLHGIDRDLVSCLDEHYKGTPGDYSRCFLAFQDLLRGLSYASRTSLPDMAAPEDFFYQSWSVRQPMVNLGTEALPSSSPEKYLTLGDAITIYNRDLASNYQVGDGRDVPDIAIWLKLTSEYPVFLSNLRRASLDPRSFPGYGEASAKSVGGFDSPESFWRQLLAAGAQIERFVREKLYAKDVYRSAVTKLVADTEKVSQLIGKAAQSLQTRSRTSSLATSAINDKISGIGRSTDRVGVDCNDAQVFKTRNGTPVSNEGSFGQPFVLPQGVTFNAFIPEEYWIAQFLDQGMIYVCYRHRLIGGDGVHEALEIQGHFVAKTSIPGVVSAGSDQIVAARSFESRPNFYQTEYMQDETTANYHWRPAHDIGGIFASGHWADNFYSPQYNWKNPLFGTEPVVNGSLGKTLSLLGLKEKLRYYFPRLGSGELPPGGARVATYFDEAFGSQLAPELTQALLRLDTDFNHLALAAKLEAAVSTGRSSCGDALADLNPQSLFELAVEQYKHSELDHLIQARLARPAQTLMESCSSDDPKDLPLLVLVDEIDSSIVENGLLGAEKQNQR